LDNGPDSYIANTPVFLGDTGFLGGRRKVKRGIVCGVLALLVLVLAPLALAQTPSERGYGGAGGVVGEVGGGGGGGGVSASGSGGLPFTGLDLAFLVGGGLLLIALGVGLRRFGRARA
jgi:hypothetical protein